ncbi:hypothetical protein BFW01_g8006 [Lasiodiplodia theobromae]|nr:hypothetical protein BFW01_g8006 [Lasiodiplodia theobromae]
MYEKPPTTWKCHKCGNDDSEENEKCPGCPIEDEKPITWVCCQCGKTNSGDDEECATSGCGHCPGMEGCCEWDW